MKAQVSGLFLLSIMILGFSLGMSTMLVLLIGVTI